MPRKSEMTGPHNRVSHDWDKWLQVVQNALDALGAVTVQGDFADPNTNVVASPGAIYTTAAGGAGVTLWVKESGVNTDAGWVSK